MSQGISPIALALSAPRDPRILILKPSSLGDVVQALPVMRHLKRWRPDASIHWWIDSNLQPLLAGDPDLAAAVPFHRKRWASPRYWDEMVASVRELREQRYDWVIDLQALARSAVFTWLANGALSIGLGDWREGAPAAYDLVVPRPSFHTHAVDWYLSVLHALGVPTDGKIDWLPERPADAEAVRPLWPSSAGRRILLQPGARWQNKRWPVQRFAGLVKRLAAAHADDVFVILGGASDRELAAAIADAAPGRCLNLAGRTSLAEMVEWIRQGDLLVTNDTGPMHVAAALRKPVVALFGPTEPRRTGPYGQLDQVLQATLPCVPCLSDRCRVAPQLACWEPLTVDWVADAVTRRLISRPETNSRGVQS